VEVPSRPKATALTRNRASLPLSSSAVEVSHKPSAVAWPSSRWNTALIVAPPFVGAIPIPSPEYCFWASVPSWAKGMDLAAAALAAGWVCA
jgi:hypothetical protein